MIAAVVTGASCNDLAGGWLKVNSFKKSSLEIWQGPRVGWPLTTSSALDTQVAQMAHNDHEGFLYWSEVIVIAALMTRAICNDPTRDWLKVNFLKRSSQKVDKIQG